VEPRRPRAEPQDERDAGSALGDDDLWENLTVDASHGRIPVAVARDVGGRVADLVDVRRLAARRSRPFG
jgi:hypothetical protein